MIHTGLPIKKTSKVLQDSLYNVKIQKQNLFPQASTPVTYHLRQSKLAHHICKIILRMSCVPYSQLEQVICNIKNIHKIKPNCTFI